MPVNITQGNTARFIVEFLDSSGNLSSPDGGTLDITYPTGVTSASTSIALTASGSFYTANWDSSVSALGTADWSVTATGSLIAADSGTLRVIGP